MKELDNFAFHTGKRLGELAGEFLPDSTKNTAQAEVDYKTKYLELLEKYTKLLEDHIALQSKLIK